MGTIIKGCFKLYGETYTDVWARIINAMFFSIDNSKNYEEYIIFLQKSLYVESLFSYFQGLNILKKNNITYNDLRNNINKINNYNEGSNVYCYYVLTGILMSNIDAFINQCVNNNTEIINFNNSINNHRMFISQIIHIMRSNNFIILDKILGNYKLNIKTLRMSIIE